MLFRSLGSCANAPMAQIGKDYYEDLTTESFGKLLDDMAAGKVPVPGPQNGRYASEPLSGLTSLKDHESGRAQYNASAQLAVDIGDSIKRIDGTEVPLLTPWQGKAANKGSKPAKADAPAPRKAGDSADKNAKIASEAGDAKSKAKPEIGKVAPASENAETRVAGAGVKPDTRDAPDPSGADDLKLIKGIGPKLEKMLNEMGFFHYDQIANWDVQQVAWVDQNLQGFKGRVSRDNWVDQAGNLAAGEQTAFAAKARKDGRYDD